MNKRLSEKQAWTCLSKPKNWYEDGDYRNIFGSSGLCNAILTMKICKDISEQVFHSMLTKINNHRKKRRLGKSKFIWSTSSKRGNLCRRKFCEDQAKKF
jgi:hypothetical protein